MKHRGRRAAIVIVLVLLMLASSWWITGVVDKNSDFVVADRTEGRVRGEVIEHGKTCYNLSR